MGVVTLETSNLLLLFFFLNRLCGCVSVFLSNSAEVSGRTLKIESYDVVEAFEICQDKLHKPVGLYVSG